MPRLIDLKENVIVYEDMNKDVPVGFRKGSVTYLGHDDSTHGINKQFYLKCDELAKDHELYGDAIFLVDRKVAKKMVLEKGRRVFRNGNLKS